MTETTSAWQDTSLAPRERAKKLVEAMTLEQKIAQLHGAMETIDIYAITAQAAESGADMDQLAAQIRVERHVKAIDELLAAEMVATPTSSAERTGLAMCFWKPAASARSRSSSRA